MNSERYSRQSMVQEFSGEGQQLLEDASVLVIGASSIGSTLMYNLASAGVGTIGLSVACDRQLTLVERIRPF